MLSEVIADSEYGKSVKCLNPCCSGICSLSIIDCEEKFRKAVVLILVVVEYALWAQ